MSRVALLMGVSRYGMGLASLPSAQKDVEVMKRVLKQPQFQFEPVLSLCDRPLQEMQEAIELFFKQRASDDQIIFVYCGHTLQDADGRLYFATPNTTVQKGALLKAQLIPAATLREAMDSSPARQQVVILNSYYQQVPDQPVGATSIDLLATALEGTGRAVLTAANVAQPAVTDALDAWTYIRYFTEGIESGAADEEDKGLLTAAALHRYASKKLHIAAPALETHLAGSAEMADIPLLEVPQSTPQLHYRKVLEATPIATDAAGTPVLERRSLLNDIRHSLGLSPREAAALEAQVLRPQQEYRQRLTMYRETVTESARSPNVPLAQRRQAWKQLQQALYLKDQDVAMITIVPSFALQQHQQAQYQGNLTHYQQVLLGAMQRQFPLQERDRAMLHRLQQTLHLGEEDVQALEDQLTGQAKQFVADDDRHHRHHSEPENNAEPEAVIPPPRPQPVNPSPTPVPEGDQLNPQAPSPLTETPSPEVSASLPPDDSRAKAVIMQRLFNLNEPNPLPPEPPAPVPLPSPVTTVQEAPSPIQPSAKPNFMDRIRRSTSNYQALIVPGILLAAILGILAAIMQFSNRPNWFKFGQQTPVDLVAAQQLNAEGLRKAQLGDNEAAIADYTQAIEKNPNDVSAYTNRGAAYHRLGNTGAAIGDYERALTLTPQTAEQTAVLHSNLSYAYYDRQNYDKALEEGNRAVALSGNFAQAHINLANARSKKGDYDGAIQDYNRALLLRPAAAIQAGAYSNRGNAQFAQTRTKEAIRDYNQAIKLQPDYADAYYNLGLAQQSLNDRAAAINSFQTAARYYQTQGKDAQQKEATDRADALQNNR